MVDEEADAAGGGGGSSWTWFESARDGTRLTLAHIELSGDRVLLQVNSRARLDRATAMLREAAGAVVLSVDVQTSEQLLAKARARAGRPGSDVGHRDDIPSEGGKNAVGQVMEAHYRRWVDEPLPKFGNRTPRQMASVDPGAVARAIWYICNGPIGMKYDARWMYAELGVRALGEDLFAPGLLEGAGGAEDGAAGQ